MAYVMQDGRLSDHSDLCVYRLQTMNQQFASSVVGDF